MEAALGDQIQNQNGSKQDDGGRGDHIIVEGEAAHEIDNTHTHRHQVLLGGDH